MSLSILVCEDSFETCHSKRSGPSRVANIKSPRSVVWGISCTNLATSVFFVFFKDFSKVGLSVLCAVSGGTKKDGEEKDQSKIPGSWNMDTSFLKHGHEFLISDDIPFVSVYIQFIFFLRLLIPDGVS